MSPVLRFALLQRQITRQAQWCANVEQQIVNAAHEAACLQRSFTHVTIMLHQQLQAGRQRLGKLQAELDELCQPVRAVA